MEDKQEFHELNHSVSNLIRRQLMDEHEFMAYRNFYNTDRNKRFRMLAASTIVSQWSGFRRDMFVPYLAMNYFDRFISTGYRTLKGKEGRSVTEEVGLVAFACLATSAKLRQKSFSVNKFAMYSNFENPLTVKNMMYDISTHLRLGVDWQMRSVTAFTFLNYYYHYFKNIGIIKRRWIYEILVQAQGELTFVNYRPSLMAFSAFIAALTIAYPSKCKEVANALAISEILSKELVQECANLMVELCYEKNIKIEPPESKIDLTSSTVGESSKLKIVAEEVEEVSYSHEQDVAKEVTEAEARRMAKGKGRAVDMTKTSDEKARAEALTPPALEKDKEGVEEDAQPRIPGKAHKEFLELVAPEAVNMNFELKWLILGEPAQPKCFSCGTCTIV